MNITDLLNKAESLLQGEPARAIGYGAALVIVGVSLASNALGFTRIPQVDLTTAVVDATAAIAIVVGVIESIRRLVTPVAAPNLPAPVNTDVAVEGDST